MADKSYSSELKQFVTLDKFKVAYDAFIKQVESNVITGVSNGTRFPEGFEKNNSFDGATFSQSFGRGHSSKAPYMNWWVVSIYYVHNDGKLVLGIEGDRYPHLDKMKPNRYAKIGNKFSSVAVFYEAFLEKVDISVLYDVFIRVSEEVMKLGVVDTGKKSF